MTTPSARALALAREALRPCAGPSECATADGTHDKLSCHSCAWCAVVAQAIDRAGAETQERCAQLVQFYENQTPYQAALAAQQAPRSLQDQLVSQATSLASRIRSLAPLGET